MDDPYMRSAFYSLAVALIIATIAGIRGYGSLEAKLNYVATEQTIVRQTLKDIAVDIDVVQNTRYTDIDGARDMARIDSQLSDIRREMTQHQKMIANNLVAIARYQETRAQERP